MLYIPLDIMQKLKTYVHAVSGEIGGLGKVSVEGQNFRVEEIYLLEQTVSGSETDLNEASIAKLVDELIDQDKSPVLNFWWHSHGNMGAFWSKTDTDTMESWPGSWLVSLVINQKSEMKARLVTNVPIKLTLDENVEVCMPELANKDELLAEVKAKVTQQKILVPKPVPPVIHINKQGNTGTKKKQKGQYVAPIGGSPKKSHSGGLSPYEFRQFCGKFYNNQCKNQACTKAPDYECDDEEVIEELLGVDIYTEDGEKDTPLDKVATNDVDDEYENYMYGASWGHV